MYVRRHTWANNSLWIAVVLQRGIVDIPGTIEIERLEENFRGPNVEITEDEAKKIRKAVIAANINRGAVGRFGCASSRGASE
ncbi:hypothetical protein V1505DRAFT_374705 [Lipomyces doorenjongii]